MKYKYKSNFTIEKEIDYFTQMKSFTTKHKLLKENILYFYQKAQKIVPRINLSWNQNLPIYRTLYNLSLSDYYDEVLQIYFIDSPLHESTVIEVYGRIQHNERENFVLHVFQYYNPLPTSSSMVDSVFTRVLFLLTSFWNPYIQRLMSHVTDSLSAFSIFSSKLKI